MTPADDGDIDLEAIKAQTPGCGGTRELIAAVETLRKRVAEATGALESVKGQFGPDAHRYGCECNGCNPPADSCAQTRRKVLAVLDATPTEALKRARAKDEAYEKMVRFLDDWAAQFVCWGMLTDDEANSAVQTFVVRAHEITTTAPAAQEALGKEEP